MEVAHLFDADPPARFLTAVREAASGEPITQDVTLIVSGLAEDSSPTVMAMLQEASASVLLKALKDIRDDVCGAAPPMEPLT